MRRSAAIICFVGALVGCTTLLYPVTTMDSAAFYYVGKSILEGSTPYRDVWDIHGPGIFFFYALSFFLFGKSAIAFRVLDIVWQTATALLLAQLGTRLARKEMAGLITGVAYLAGYFSQNYWSMAHVDSELSLPLALAIFFLFQAVETDRFLQWALAAAGVGVATLFSLLYGLCGIVALFAAWRMDGTDFRKFLRRCAALAVGFLLPLLLLGLFFYAKGGLIDLLTTQLIVAVQVGRRYHDVILPACIARSLLISVHLPLYFMAAVGFGAFGLRPTENQRTRLAVEILFGWLAVGVTALVIHGLYHAYHFLPLLAPASVLFGVVASSRLTRDPTGSRVLHYAVLLVIALTLVVPLKNIGAHARFAWSRISGQRSADVWNALATELRQRTLPQDRIYEWGNNPEIYVNADRKAASRFIVGFYVTRPWDHVDYRGTLLSEISANKPVFFIVSKRIPIDVCSTTGAADFPATFEQFDELKRIVAGQYVLDRETPDYTLYRRADSNPGSPQAIPPTGSGLPPPTNMEPRLLAVRRSACALAPFRVRRALPSLTIWDETF
jgi:hypothetical protein